jgi:hypothetical protein
MGIISLDLVKSYAQDPTTMRMNAQINFLFITPYHMPVIMHVHVICQTNSVPQRHHHLHQPVPNLVQVYGKEEQFHFRHEGLAPQSGGEEKVVIQVRVSRLHRYLSQSYAQLPLPLPHRDRAAQHEIFLTSLDSQRRQ